jgi:hypothetical protein
VWSPRVSLGSLWSPHLSTYIDPYTRRDPGRLEIHGKRKDGNLDTVEMREFTMMVDLKY